MENNQKINLSRSNNVLYSEELVNKVGGGMFSLIRVAMLRAIEIHAGKPPLVKHDFLDKATTIALMEIAQGKVVLKTKKN